MVFSALQCERSVTGLLVAVKYLFSQAESRQSIQISVDTNCQSLQFAVHPAKCNVTKMGTEHKKIRVQVDLPQKVGRGSAQGSNHL